MALDERDKITHLLRRAGFAAQPKEIEDGVARGLGATVDQIVNFETTPDNLSAPPTGLDYNATVNGNPNPPRGYLVNVVGWWLNAMIKTNRPLQEKMVLFWHSLFATSAAGVQDVRQMFLQNQLFRGNFNPLLPSQRRTAEDTTSPFPAGNFRNILLWLTRDPAMGYWLDNNLNTQKDNQVGTNENYARELQELFSLGVQDVVTKVPNYTETDVRQASRVLTGWGVTGANPRNPQPIEGQPNNFPRWFAFFGPAQNTRIRHDPGPYTVLGVTFSSSGADNQGRRLFDVIVQRKNAGQPQSASGRFIGYRLFKFFGYEDPEPEIINALADVFDGRNGEQPYTIKNMLRTIFTPGNIVSEAFYSEKAFRAHIKSPVEYLIGSYRLLRPQGITVTYETTGVPDAITTSAEVTRADNWLAQMGQRIFVPPDVSGWKEGPNWVNTTFDLARFNFANAFIAAAPTTDRNGQVGSIPGPFTTDAVRSLLNGAQTPEQVVDTLTNLLWQVPPSTEIRTALVNYLRAGTNGTPGTYPFNVANNATIDIKVRGLIHLVMASPEYLLS